MKSRGGVIAPSVKLGKLHAPVRLFPFPEYSTLPDWSLIDWRYRVSRVLWDYIGFHPSIAREMGVIGFVLWRWGEGRSIDLIPAGFSSRKVEEEDKGIRRKESRIERALRRLERVSECGSRGHILLAQFSTGVEVRYHPHRCHSIFCPYCSYVNFKESYARLLPVLEGLSVNGRLSFLTLTHRNTRVRGYEDVDRAVEEAYASIQKLYQFRLFGKRNWFKVRREFVREALSYYRNSKVKFGLKEARRRVKRQIDFFRDFEHRYRDYIGSDIKFGQLLNAVVKFELTYNSERGEVHPHWHFVVADFRIPKLLMVVIWRMVSGSSIVDIRSVQGVRDATAELVKYVTKGWEFPSGDIRVWVEAVMLGRKKFRVWGFEVLELEEGVQEKGRFTYLCVNARLKCKRNLHDVPRLVRRMRRQGEKEVFFDKLIVDVGGFWEVDLYVSRDGDLVIRDEGFLAFLEEFGEEVEVLGDGW